VCDTVRVRVPPIIVETTIERVRITPRRQRGAGLLHLSVGLEDVDDLWCDLDAALEAPPDPADR